MHEDLMEQVVTQDNATAAWLAVTRNGGAPGIDGMTTQQLRDHVRQHWETIRGKLLTGTYVPSPVRRVEIPKPNGGIRLLGIPTVLDRWIQQMLLQVLQAIFDSTFSAHSFGFRPGKSAHDAVRAAQSYVQAGKDWVVDMDITKFFDRVNHDILMNRLGQTIRDKRVLGLIGRYLRAGVMVEGLVQASEEGTPQGGPLSPLLANIYLDALDRELEQRGLAFSRYADDCNIYVGSERSAERVLTSLTAWIAKHLRLEVNATKSGTGRPWERKFLGFRINREGKIEAAPPSVERFRMKVRELWRSCQSQTSEKLRDNWCAYVQGWWGYYRLAEDRRNLFGQEGWIRRHIRACFWQRWDNWRGRLRKLRALGLSARLLKVAHSAKGAWLIAASPSLQTALNNAVLRRHGFWMPSDLASP
ncbi:MAG: group II intron reverse transcriptase/maturase [Gammaproteobacteria bacterium]|nr:group II intron reverse transcriptase/maturase [Gammaproteobacteria bacterium]